jgi:ABC-2 type transport system ATP-binding protein
LVEVENLTKRYGDVLAIDGVTFQAREGEILAFLGKNGAGKTTTMRIMTGFMPPTAGTVRINGHDIREDSLEARRLIGYLPETAPLYEDMSVQGYLTFCAKLRQVPAAEVPGRVDTVMKAVHIDERRAWQIGKLSKGLRRRVGLAQALVHNPRVLILDEPTEGLDPEQIIEIRNLIRNLRGDHTVILSTHILPEAQALADRIVIIHDRRIVAVDTAENLTAAVQRAQRLRVEVEGPTAEVRQKLQSITGVKSVELLDEAKGQRRARYLVESDRETDLREKIAAAVVGSGWALLELERLELSLEDIFLHLTGYREEPADGRVRPRSGDGAGRRARRKERDGKSAAAEEPASDEADVEAAEDADAPVAEPTEAAETAVAAEATE